MPPARQHEVIHALLAKLAAPSSSSSDRHASARHLLHIAHGTFAPNLAPSPEHHLHLILTNCRTLREAGALPRLWHALKRTAREWEDLSHLPVSPEHEHAAPATAGGDGPHDDQHLHPNSARPQMRHAYSANRRAIDAQEEEFRAAERQEKLDEANAELALLLAVLYFMTECSRGDDAWGDELSAFAFNRTAKPGADETTLYSGAGPANAGLPLQPGRGTPGTECQGLPGQEGAAHSILAVVHAAADVLVHR